MEHVVCDYCGKDDQKPLWKTLDRLGKKEAFTIVRCRNCGLVFVNPRPNEQEIKNYYPESYQPYHPLRGISGVLRTVLLHREVRKLRKYLKPDARILEVGSGSGQDLAFIRDSGWQRVVGTDVSENSAREAKKEFGIEVLVGTLESLKFPDNSFDHIRMKYVISHVHSPKKLLEEVRRILKPGGSLVIWIPNFDSLDRTIFGRYWEGQEPPRHLYDFGEYTFRRHLETSGFTVREVDHSIVPNTFVHSFRNMLQEGVGMRGIGKYFGLNPVTLSLFLPFSVIAALFRKSDRIIVYAQKPI